MHICIQSFTFKSWISTLIDLPSQQSPHHPMWATGVPHLLAQVGPCVLPMFSPHGQNVGAAQRPTCSPPVLPMFSPDVVWHRWGTGGAHVCQPMFLPGLPIRSPAVPHMFNGQFGLPWLKVGHFPAHKIRRYCTVGYYATSFCWLHLGFLNSRHFML